jgi:hypothetical protein
MRITYSECVFVASVIQHAKWCMHRILLASVVCLVLPYFSTLSNKRHDFQKKKVIESKMCVLIFSTSFISNISYSKKSSARYHGRT